MADRAWISTRKGLFELARGAGGWRIARVSFLGEPVTSVLPPDPSAPSRPMIAALNLGHFGVKCHASDDEGASWHEVGVPVYPAQPEDGAGDVAWKLVQIWTLAAQGDDIWAGTLPGGLFHSRDGGRHWALNEALWSQPGRRAWFGGGYDVPGIHSIEIGCGDAASGDTTAPAGAHGDGAPRASAQGDRACASQRLLVGISCGGVWASDDGGQHWLLRTNGMRASYVPPESADDGNIQDPHRVVACRARPQRLWCQHHEGIWTSHDAGGHWRRIENVPLSSFGFAVAADPSNPDRAWFVPAVADQRRLPVDAALAVLRTDDGGESFRTLREGLPSSHCYDLVYRHSLDVGRDGRTLLMGSTTGGLWASDDAGEHWQTVSTSLPPIYAVTLGLQR